MHHFSCGMEKYKGVEEGVKWEGGEGDEGRGWEGWGGVQRLGEGMSGSRGEGWSDRRAGERGWRRRPLLIGGAGRALPLLALSHADGAGASVPGRSHCVLSAALDGANFPHVVPLMPRSAPFVSPPTPPHP